MYFSEKFLICPATKKKVVMWLLENGPELTGSSSVRLIDIGASGIMCIRWRR